MQEPVLLTLDGTTYEKDAIVAWLSRSRTSPLTRDTMQPDQTIAIMIQPNRNLASAIEAFKETNPELFDSQHFFSV